jgi:V/A-type H+-transporting ATPase subunit K
MMKRFNAGLGIAALVAVACASLFLVNPAAAADGDEGSTTANGGNHPPTAEALLTPDGHARVIAWAFLGAAIATGIGSLAAGYAVGQVGTAAMGAVAEKPELMGKSLIYVALAEGIAIYGLLIAIIVLAKV